MKSVALTSREETVKQGSESTELKELELEVARVIEEKFLRAKDPKGPHGIKDVSIDGGTVKFTVKGGSLRSPRTMLESEFFTKNRLSVVNLKFAKGGSEISVEKTSDRSFNYVVTKGSVVISLLVESCSFGARGDYAVVKACANGTVRVTYIEKLRKRFQRDQMSGINVSISGVSVFDMLHNGNWERNKDGTYTTRVSDYSLAAKVARVIEEKFLRAKDPKGPHGIKDVSIDGGTVKFTVKGGSLRSPRTMLESEFFTKNRLSVVNLKFAKGGSEISVEKTSDRSFNYVVTKGSVVISLLVESCSFGARGDYAVVKACANGTVRVTHIEKLRKRFQRDQMSGINVSISGVSVFDMLHNGNWERSKDGTYITRVSDYSLAAKVNAQEQDGTRGTPASTLDDKSSQLSEGIGTDGVQPRESEKSIGSNKEGNDLLKASFSSDITDAENFGSTQTPKAKIPYKGSSGIWDATNIMCHAKICPEALVKKDVQDSSFNIAPENADNNLLTNESHDDLPITAMSQCKITQPIVGGRQCVQMRSVLHLWYDGHGNITSL